MKTIQELNPTIVKIKFQHGMYIYAALLCGSMTMLKFKSGKCQFYFYMLHCKSVKLFHDKVLHIDI